MSGATGDSVARGDDAAESHDQGAPGGAVVSGGTSAPNGEDLPSGVGTPSVGEPPVPPKSRYAMGSAANMFRSLVVILALMLGLIFLVPRVNSLSGPVVDIHATAVDVKAQSGWPIVEPRGLPAGWTPTAARYVRATDDKMTWLAGYQTPDGTYVSVEQTESASSEWIAAQINRATRTGEIEHDGVTWVQYERGAKVQNSLVHVPEAEGELATLVTGTATFEDMLVFIDHLVPVE